jgi:dTDP-glucose 4,6-dehydratase
MSRILVTGASGTLGRPLLDELRRCGHHVEGCDLQHGPERAVHRADVAEYRQLEIIFDAVRPDAVVHLAGEFGRHNGEQFYEQVWKTNAIGTRNVLELCNRHDARLIFASSSEIYGEVEAPLMYAALSDERPLWQPNEYALSKRVNEIQIANFVERHGIEAVVLRFFNVYGPGEHYHAYRSVVALFCHRALMGIPWTVYEGYERAFQFVGDFIPTLANAIDAPVGTYNVGGEDFRSVRELSDLVLDETGADPLLVTYLPEDEHNVVSKRPDNTRARQVLGHDPIVKLEQGVPATIAWIKRQTKGRIAV